jgi:acetyl-CoA/propionyl-CoA carboxylase carboxyl transferase subunit
VTEDPAPQGVDPRDPEDRLERFFDPGSMRLLAERDTSGVVAARGTVQGSPTIAYCTDATVMGGAMGLDGCRHIVDAIDAALRERVPSVGIWHSGGARLAEGVTALHAVGEVFAAMVRASGRIPQISVVLGAAAGGAAYGPALTDLVIMGPAGRVFVTGPDVVRSVTGEDVDQEKLGGPDTHGRRSGVVHVVTDSEAAALATARTAVDLLAAQGELKPADDEADVDLGALLPEQRNRAYDVKPLVTGVLDQPGLELHPRFAPNVVTTLGRLAGRTVGVIANNPLRLGGCLDSASAEKAARFVRMCDAFGVPLVVLVDVPGYLPGVGQEWDGVVRRGAKLLHAFAEAVVPRVTLVTRKSFGGAYIAMNARSLGATTVYAWPGAEVAVMGAKAAVGILHRKKLAAAPPHEREALHAQLAEEHERIAGGVNRALEIGVVDEVIEPSQTRRRLVAALAAAPPGRGAHGNGGPHRTQVVRTPLPRRRPDDRSQITTPPPVAEIRRDGFGTSYDLVQPGDGAAVAGVPVDLEVGVPGGAQELVDAVPEGLDRAGRGRQVPQLLLADHDVAVGAGGRTEDAVAGHVGHALAVVAVAGFLGHLEAQHRPRAQRGDQPGSGAGRTRPRHLGTVGTVCRGLVGPRQGNRRADDAFQRPLDVLAERLRARVHEDDTLGRPSLHGAPPSKSIGLVFPYGPSNSVTRCIRQ